MLRFGLVVNVSCTQSNNEIMFVCFLYCVIVFNVEFVLYVVYFGLGGSLVLHSIWLQASWL